MSSISVELSTTASPTTTSGKFEVNANVETPTAGTPGTYRQLQGNIRGDSPSLTSSGKSASDMESSGGVQLPGGGGEDDGDGSGQNGGRSGEIQKQVSFDRKVSSSEDDEMEAHNKGSKSGEKKKRRLHLSFPRFGGGKGKKTSRGDDGTPATDSTESDEIPEKKAKVDEEEKKDDNGDVKRAQMEGEIEQKHGESSGSIEQDERNVDTSGCGDAEARANMAAMVNKENMITGIA